MSNTKNRKQRRQLEKEQNLINDYRRKYSKIRSKLVLSGYKPYFIDIFDSYKYEFNKIVNEAKNEFKTLYGIYEVDSSEFRNINRSKFRIPVGWEKIEFSSTDEQIANEYEQDAVAVEKATYAGSLAVFQDQDSNFHTIILVIRNPKTFEIHEEFKYSRKISTLLHEIGHLKDFENRINIKPEIKFVDLIGTEVYANLHSLNESFKREYYLSAEHYLDALKKSQHNSEFQYQVVQKTLLQFKKPEYTPWCDLFNQEI
mgnify:CR=1 FL=1